MDLKSVTMSEIRKEQQNIEQFKKENNLPSEYGFIDELPDYYLLKKHIDIPATDFINFKGIIITIGKGLNGNMVINSIYYPKSDFSKEEVTKMGYLSTNCPYCLGRKKFFPMEELDTYINPHANNQIRSRNLISKKTESNTEEKNTMLEKFIRMFDPYSFSFGNVAIAAGGSSILNAIIDNMTNAGGRFALKLIGGVASVGTSFIPQLPPIAKKYLMLFGINFLQAIPEPGGVVMGYAGNQFTNAFNDLKRAKNALMGYGVADAVKKLLSPSALSFLSGTKMGGPIGGPKGLVKYAIGERLAVNPGSTLSNLKKLPMRVNMT